MRHENTKTKTKSSTNKIKNISTTSKKPLVSNATCSTTSTKILFKQKQKNKAFFKSSFFFDFY